MGQNYSNTSRMNTEYSQQLFNQVREYLMSSSNKALDDKRTVPAGATQTFFFLLPPQPKNECDEVYPGIVIGGQAYGRDKNKLKDLGITHVVNCAKGTRFNQINTDASTFKDVGIQFHGIQAADIMTFNMTPHFEAAADFIDKALANNGKVYVHCQQGVSRSSTVVLAYLMLKKQMKLLEAVQTLRKKREIHPNDGFIKQLCILNEHLYGERKSC